MNKKFRIQVPKEHYYKDYDDLTRFISYFYRIDSVIKLNPKIFLEFGPQAIANIVGIDYRIGKYGTIHGKTFGGKCLPKDLKAFTSFARSHNKETKLLTAVDDINEKMKEIYGVRE